MRWEQIKGRTNGFWWGRRSLLHCGIGLPGWGESKTSAWEGSLLNISMMKNWKETPRKEMFLYGRIITVWLIFHAGWCTTSPSVSLRNMTTSAFISEPEDAGYNSKS